MKDKAQVTTKIIISTFILKKTQITIAITLCYDFALSHNAFIVSRIVITKETYLKINEESRAL
jgi:hypothetical protein